MNYNRNWLTWYGYWVSVIKIYFLQAEYINSVIKNDITQKRAVFWILKRYLKVAVILWKTPSNYYHTDRRKLNFSNDQYYWKYTRESSNHLNISRTTIRRIIRKNKFYPYHIKNYYLMISHKEWHIVDG